MKLLLLRHAQAEPGADLDPDRRLTPVGEAQARTMAARVGMLLPNAHVVSSPWLRAAQTGEIIARALGRGVMHVPALTPEGRVSEAAEQLETCFSDSPALVVVTHQPLCGQLLTWLTDGSLHGQAIATCSGALLELEWPARGMARQLSWHDAAAPQA